MWTPQIGSLLQLDGLGMAQVISVLYAQTRDPLLDMVVDGNPVPRILRYTLEVHSEGVHRIELHVYYEPPKEILHVCWSRVGGLTKERKKVTVF